MAPRLPGHCVMTPLAVFPIWADTVRYRACRILMYPDRWTIEVSGFGCGVTRAEVSSIEDAFDLADECRPECLGVRRLES